LNSREKTLFLAAVRKINAAFSNDPASGDLNRPKCPNTLRIKDVEGAPGIWEMTWSFSGRDGRATFEFIEIAGERTIRWRRIGGHAIFSSP